jgi:hypothetical protein
MHVHSSLQFSSFFNNRHQFNSKEHLKAWAVIRHAQGSPLHTQPFSSLILDFLFRFQDSLSLFVIFAALIKYPSIFFGFGQQQICNLSLELFCLQVPSPPRKLAAIEL